MNRLLTIAAAALSGFLIAGTAARAHPHVWVTMKSNVVYAPDGTLIGIRHAWTFDDMYSAFAVQGLDQKEKGKFTTEELQPLAKVNVEALKEYDYFSFARVNGKMAQFVDPVEYRLEYDSKQTVLKLHFLLPFKTPVKAKALRLEVFDPEYFVDFALDQNDPVALEGAPNGCALNLDKPKGLSQELAQRLAAVPADGKIPPGSYGEAFANKIMVTCP